MVLEVRKVITMLEECCLWYIFTAKHHDYLQELHWTNKPKAERICATRLGYRPFICSDQSRGLLSFTRPLHTALGDGEESRINNFSVKSCEKHSNSAQNSVKDIRTNATDVETRKNIVQ